MHIPFIPLRAHEIDKEREKLRRFFDVKGTRTHYLRGKYPHLLQELNKIGISYDSSFGFNDNWSFRFGTSYPFNPLVDDNPLDIVEIPLNLMDVNIKDYDQFRHYIEEVFRILRNTHSVYVINWHPHRFNVNEFGEIPRKSFEYILELGNRNNAWMTLLGNLLRELEQKR